MYRFTLLLFSGLLMSFAALGHDHLSVIESEIEQARAEGIEFTEVNLFTLNHDPNLRLTMDKVIEEATFLDLDSKAARKVYDADAEAIRFVIPASNGRQYVVSAIKNELFTEGFQVTTQEGNYGNYYLGRYYKGVVEGMPGRTMASISIFQNEVVAILSTESMGNLVLAEMELKETKKARPYVLYDDKDFMVNLNFDCHTPDPDVSHFGPRNNDLNPAAIDPSNCIKWYFEVDFEFFQLEGSVQESINKMTAIYNEVAVVYQNESTVNLLDGIFVWTEEDPYTEGGNSATPLNEFANLRTPLPGSANVAHLVSVGFGSNQGIAGSIGGICPERPVLAGTTHAFNAITSAPVAPFPVYTFPVFLICHENGHVVGSTHTHGCYWNGVYPNGGSQIDDCGSLAGTSEGAACYDPANPIIPPNLGTIMSYCSLIDVGVDLVNGFGPQPGDVIRDYIYDETCADPCGETPCPSVNGVVSDVSCAGESNGSIDLTVFGGSPPYGFNWSNGATTEDIDNLSPGSYVVTVSDASGSCDLVRAFLVEDGGGAIAIMGDITPEAEEGQGAIDITVTGGVNPFSFLWSNGETTEDIANLTSGTYSVTATDANGCEEFASFFVPTEVGCQAVINEFPFNEGFESGTLGVFGQGTGDDFNWEANSGPTPTGRTGPSSAFEGSFYAYAEASGNTGGRTAILVGCFDFTGLTGPSMSFAYNMYGSNIGSLSIEVADVNSGESAIVWTQTSNQGAFWQTATANLTGFGGRNVEVRFISTTGIGSSDRADIAIDDVIVDVGPACDPPLVSVSSTDASCSNTADGTATATATGGAPPYTYQWSSGQTTAIATGLAPGTYGVTVTDAADCAASGATTVGAPSSLGLSFAVIGESAPGAADGEIDLTVTGGTPGYSYDWSNGATTEDLVGLSEGIYSVTVTDSNGCTTSGSTEVFVGGGGTCNDEGIGLPVSQGFELEFGEFENNGDFNWSRNSGSTPTRRTGPSGAFAGSFYGLAEANGNQGDQAILLSPCLDLTGLQATAEFAYHMYGVTMGSLSFEIAENGGPNWITLWSASGDQGNQWNTQSIDLSAYEGLIVRVRWVATIGGGGAARSDIGLDAISLTSGGSSTLNDDGSSGNSGGGSGGGTFGGGIFTGGSYGGLFGFEKADNPNVSVTALVPVPARNNLTVNLEANVERTGTVRVLDYTGRMIEERQEVFQKGSNSFEIDVANYSSGLYFLSIDTGDSRTVKKFEVID